MKNRLDNFKGKRPGLKSRRDTNDEEIRILGEPDASKPHSACTVSTSATFRDALLLHACAPAVVIDARTDGESAGRAGRPVTTRGRLSNDGDTLEASFLDGIAEVHGACNRLRVGAVNLAGKHARNLNGGQALVVSGPGAFAAGWTRQVMPSVD